MLGQEIFLCFKEPQFDSYLTDCWMIRHVLQVAKRAGYSLKNHTILFDWAQMMSEAERYIFLLLKQDKDEHGNMQQCQELVGIWVSLKGLS